MGSLVVAVGLMIIVFIGLIAIAEAMRNRGNRYPVRDDDTDKESKQT